MSLWLTKCSKDPPEGIGVLGSAPSFKSRNTETQQTAQHQRPLLPWQKRDVTANRGRQISHVSNVLKLSLACPPLCVLRPCYNSVLENLLHTLASHNVSFTELHNPLTHWHRSTKNKPLQRSTCSQPWANEHTAYSVGQRRREKWRGGGR